MRVVLAIGLNLLLLTWAAQASAQSLADEEAIRRANVESVQLLDEGRYTEAVALAEQTLSQAERTLGRSTRIP
jgi:hypothetical protein